MTRTSFAAVAFVLAASGAHAQEALPQTAPSSPPVPGQPQASAAISRDKLQRIYLIRQYETVLTNAVKTGANSLAQNLKLADPTSLFVTGNARARGFELDGYGVVFDVDVPTMMQSVVWSAQTLQRQQEIDKLNDILNDPRTTDAMRRMAMVELRNMQRLTAGPQQGMAMATPASNGTVRAADAPDVIAPVVDTRSPDQMYTDVIKNALIDAMLSFGPALRLADDEWLTVAARATSPGPSTQLDDSSSILIRIKGADLTAFITGKITRDAVQQKIEIKEG